MIKAEQEARKALLLLASIKMELEKGTLHYDHAGKLLETSGEIMDAWNNDGKVTVVQR